MNYLKILSVFVITFFNPGSWDEHHATPVPATKSIQVDAMPGACPYLTKNNKGQVVLSWARAINDSTSVFCYAASADSGRSFDNIVTIPTSDNLQPHSENLPRIIFKPSGEIIALWGAANPNAHNKYSGLVYYSQSFDEGKTWSTSKPLVNDTAGYDQRYYDVALLPSGEAAIIWLDNRKKTGREGSALYFAVTNGNNGFEGEKMISEGCCQCCRTDLFVDGTGGIHVLYRGIIQDSIRDMLHSVSTDGANSFSEPKLISNDNWVLRGCPHTGPSMTENKNGLHFAWFTGGRKKGCFYAQSGNNGNSFTSHERISESGSHPQIVALANGDVLVAWDESVQVKNENFRRIALQRRSGKGSGNMQRFITTDTVKASYPVLTTVDDQSSVIAYIEKKGKKDYIMYQRVELYQIIFH